MRLRAGAQLKPKGANRVSGLNDLNEKAALVGGLKRGKLPDGRGGRPC